MRSGTNGIDGEDEESRENRDDRDDRDGRERIESRDCFFDTRVSLLSLFSLSSLCPCPPKLARKFLVRRVADATLGKNPDDGLYKKYCSLSGSFLLAAADAPLSREISC